MSDSTPQLNQSQSPEINELIQGSNSPTASPTNPPEIQALIEGKSNNVQSNTQTPDHKSLIILFLVAISTAVFVHLPLLFLLDPNIELFSIVAMSFYLLLIPIGSIIGVLTYIFLCRKKRFQAKPLLLSLPLIILFSCSALIFFYFNSAKAQQEYAQTEKELSSISISHDSNFSLKQSPTSQDSLRTSVLLTNNSEKHLQFNISSKIILSNYDPTDSYSEIILASAYSPKITLDTHSSKTTDLEYILRFMGSSQTEIEEFLLKQAPPIHFNDKISFNYELIGSGNQYFQKYFVDSDFTVADLYAQLDQNSTTSAEPTPTPQPTQSAPTSEWQTYENQLHGFKFSYPQQIESANTWIEEKDDSIALYGPIHSGIVINIYYQTFDQCFTELQQSLAVNDGSARYESSTFNSMPVKIIYLDLDIGKAKIIVIEKKEKIILIEGDDAQPDIRQILSTFEFVE